jgi:hypothetical protein
MEQAIVDAQLEQSGLRRHESDQHQKNLTLFYRELRNAKLNHSVEWAGGQTNGEVCALCVAQGEAR